MKKRIASSLLLTLLSSALLVAGTEDPVVIDGPAVIDAPGHYVLQEDLVAGDETTVFVRIESSDVLLDGQGHRISGQSLEDSVAVHAEGASEEPLAGVTIRNVVAEDWAKGFYLERLVDASIENNIARRSALHGFRLLSFDEGSDSMFLGNRAEDGTSGFVISGINDTAFSENTAKTNSRDGFRSFFSSNITFTNNVSGSNGVDGFSLSRSNDNWTVTANVAEDNDRYGLSVALADDFVLQENELSGNRFNLDLTGLFDYSDPDFDIDDSNTVEGAPVIVLFEAEDMTLTLDEEPGYLAIVKSTGVTIEGMTLHTPNAQGVFIDNSENCLLKDLDVRNSEYGVVLNSSENITLSGVAMDENRYNLDIGRGYDHDIDSSNTTAGSPVTYLKDAEDVTIDENDNPGYIGIVDSRDITVSGVHLSNNGQGILITGAESVALSDVEITDCDTGIFLRLANNFLVENFRIADCNTGLQLQSSESSRIADGTVENISTRGLYLSHARNNLIEEVSVEVNEGSPIDFLSAWYNRVEDSVIVAPPRWDAVRLTGSENVFTGSRIYGRISLLSSISAPIERNLFYNNWIEVEAGSSFVREIFGAAGENFWSVEPKAGPNIAGGPVIAGNFWARADNSGPSQTCQSQDEGLCEEPFVINEDNIDEAPLVIPDFEMIALREGDVIDEPGYYILEEDLISSGADAFVRVESSGVTVDGLGRRLEGDEGTAVVANGPGEGIEDLVIRNLKIDGWADGIRIENTHNSHVTGNEVTGAGRALVLEESTNNEIASNYFTENAAGISLDAVSADNFFSITN